MSRPAAVVVLRRDGVEVGRWTVRSDGRPHLAVIDELARLRIGARRVGCSMAVRDTSWELRMVLHLVGLLDVLSVEVEGEPEHLEQRRVQEVVHPDDPVA